MIYAQDVYSYSSYNNKYFGDTDVDCTPLYAHYMTDQIFYIATQKKSITP